ncbi:Cellulose synthase [Melia azedarach]|uniref:Cellulose synthase n=1 Tax=Melia azedarach TaxID=155640 RepID=A0ACC1Y5M8_MELAZ|nr:Cellulose synthase [Melia azedarach]
MFKERVMNVVEEYRNGQDHPTLVEVIQDNSGGTKQAGCVHMPLLVYVSREKRPDHLHHFKAGALNVLLRVSGVISNAPYILGLDCDMYCNDPTSARQAMCFHLDPKISSSLAFVQFPQKFHNINKHDIYDGQFRSAYRVLWQGMDGLKGPVLSGTGYYIRRDSLYGSSTERGIDLAKLKNSFGRSNVFVKSLHPNYKHNNVNERNFSSALLQEAKILASCTYEHSIESKQSMEKHSLPLHLTHVHKSSTVIKRSHALLRCIAIAFLIDYRVSLLFQEPKTSAPPLLPWFLVFTAELLLSFLWLLGIAFRWRPVSRTVFPERLPEDDKLPAIDVFICTADPSKEPTVEVMNTVLSAMALDYPPEKLHVYLSDDRGSSLTLLGMKETWKFSRWWLPFCKKYGIKTICPEAFFSFPDDDYVDYGSAEFTVERQQIETKYEIFKEQVTRAIEKWKVEDKSSNRCGDHPSVIELRILSVKRNMIISIKYDEKTEVQAMMPLLVYVAREKRHFYSHNFKAGALNVLLRVSGVMSNSPYILVLDCDMYCNDPTSARRTIKNDIYDSQIRTVFGSSFYGLDSLKGPMLSGTNFYTKRVSLFSLSVRKGMNLKERKNSCGPSNEFRKSLDVDYEPSIDVSDSSNTLMQETKLLASCSYEKNSKWGEKVGFMYHSLVEDYFTGFTLHCKGWRSLYLNPERPQFLGTSITNLNDLLIQNTRWSSGLVQVGISKFCPLIYGPLRMSLLQSTGYAEFSFFPLLYCLSLWCFATIPQLCLLLGIPLYPEASSSSFYVFLFIFLSAISKHIYDVVSTGGSIITWRNEQRIWMIK